MRHVILTPIEDGWWMAEVPSLPGCHTQGESKEEAMENIREAIESYIASLEEDGEIVPEDVDVELVTV